MRPVTGWYDDVHWPSWRPTGRYIAFSRWDDESAGPLLPYRVCRVDLRRGRDHRLTRLAALPGRPQPVNAVWSPDRRRIAYVARLSSWEATGELA